ncbi:MAG: hypothetical protein CMC75_04545 [Flavobacteriaceae bacterium]|nr:hypothetical protein [Flavobacteriaceae bacterium]
MWEVVAERFQQIKDTKKMEDGGAGWWGAGCWVLHFDSAQCDRCWVLHFDSAQCDRCWVLGVALRLRSV